ncbi:MAG TPA: acyl-CoA thioesterase domain-containing protein, partial [Kofleriaceae bacterium]|nr:acyl-CoA thioesterase domain-containing protein [Kofleriaceae bacterium]
MQGTFATSSALEPAGERRFLWDLADGWQQGRGAFGGIVLGTLLRAMEACEPDRARRARSLSGEIPAPV